jgi:hypothetical protein
MSNLSQTRRRDAHEVMAEIFNFDRQTETRFLTALEEENRESAERIKTLMFTFDDLTKLDAASAQTLMRNIEKDKLAIALKGSAEPVRQLFLSNMSTHAAKMLMDDMQAMGPVRLRDVDEAQTCMRARTGRRSRSSASIAPPFRNRSWNPNCSGTRKVRSLAPSPAASASSRRRTAARCCSTKSPRWTCACRPNSCARSRNG